MTTTIKLMKFFLNCAKVSVVLVADSGDSLLVGVLSSLFILCREAKITSNYTQFMLFSMF